MGVRCVGPVMCDAAVHAAASALRRGPKSCGCLCDAPAPHAYLHLCCVAAAAAALPAPVLSACMLAAGFLRPSPTTGRCRCASCLTAHTLISACCQRPAPLMLVCCSACFCNAPVLPLPLPLPFACAWCWASNQPQQQVRWRHCSCVIFGTCVVCSWRVLAVPAAAWRCVGCGLARQLQQQHHPTAPHAALPHVQVTQPAHRAGRSSWPDLRPGLSIW
jgi:hypothetical protein